MSAGRQPVQRALDPALTPERAFSAIRHQPGCFWLDSGPVASAHGRFHHVGCQPIRSGTDADTLLSPTGTRAALLPAMRRIGYLAYDQGDRYERVPVPDGSTAEPGCWWADYAACLTWDLQDGTSWITADSDADADALLRRVGDGASPTIPERLGAGPLQVPLDRDVWTRRVRLALELIAAGDIYQVNLSHRLDASLEQGIDASDLYLALRTRSPAPMGAFLRCDDGLAVVSNSPEVFLRVDGSEVATWPLKGTRPADGNPEELRTAPKDRAEHVMIVDLERNDLGRIAIPGTVRVDGLLSVVSHPTVHHLESCVRAERRPDVDLNRLFAATFPGGSITGAPKIRAMEVIADLERAPRGVYCGALGGIEWGDARSNWSIPIRTGVVAGRTLSFRVGGGIVADSDPDDEYQETLDKARAFVALLQPD